MDGTRLEGYGLGVRLKSSSAPERAHHDGWVGFDLTFGGDGMTVTDVGRWVVSGNLQGHTPQAGWCPWR